MELNAKTLAAVKRGTAHPDTEGHEWHRYVHIFGKDDESETVVEASDGRVAVQVRIDGESSLDCCMNRTDVDRLRGKESVYIERPREAVQRVTDPFKLDLERADGQGDKLQERYPDLDGGVFAAHARRNAGGFAVRPDDLKKAATVAAELGCDFVEFHPPTPAKQIVYMTGVTERDEVLRIAVTPYDMFATRTEDGEDTESERTLFDGDKYVVTGSFPESSPSDGPEGAEPATATTRGEPKEPPPFDIL